MQGCRVGVIAAAVQPPVQPVIEDDDTPYRKTCRQRWAALIKRVFEVDPLKCPKCGAAMKIIAFIERRDQPAVVERILKHCGLWEDATARGPPAASPTQDQLALEEAERVLERPCGSKGCGVPQGREYVDTDEFLAAL